MPTLLSETVVRLERTDMLRRVQLPRELDASGYIQPPRRTPGLHLSGLLKYVAQTARISAYLDQIAEEEMPLRWALGIASEEFFASLYPDMSWQPGEVTEPVIMTPDGISELTDFGSDSGASQFVIEEFKFRRAKRMTGESLIKNHWLWVAQGAGYCLGYGCEVVRWHVISAFEFPDPVYQKFLVGFNSKELGEMRQMIERNREAAIREGYSE
jgi:hypothetical protein